MKNSITRALSFVALLCCLVVPVAHPRKPPENWDGLEPKKVKGLDNVYVRPNVEFTPYKSVLLDQVQIEFSKDWEKRHSAVAPDSLRTPPAEDMQKIRDGLAELMHEVFTEELTKHGYTLVDTPRKTRCTYARPSSISTSMHRTTPIRASLAPIRRARAP